MLILVLMLPLRILALTNINIHVRIILNMNMNTVHINGIIGVNTNITLNDLNAEYYGYMHALI